MYHSNRVYVSVWEQDTAGAKRNCPEASWTNGSFYAIDAKKKALLTVRRFESRNRSYTAGSIKIILKGMVVFTEIDLGDWLCTCNILQVSENDKQNL